jgi:transposase
VSDGIGHPLGFQLSPGQSHESQFVAATLDDVDQKLVDGKGRPVKWPDALGGDKGYRADEIDQFILELGTLPVIPSKSNEDPESRAVDFDRQIYKDRNIIERLIGWLKETRRIFSRFEKTAINFEGMIKLAFIRQYLQYDVQLAF